METTLYSIGHGRKDIKTFINELKINDIQYLVDVRSVPYSKWSPQYNRETLNTVLKDNGIKYVYFGDTIGGMPSDPSCIGEDGKYDYQKMAEKVEFKKTLLRLVDANNKKIKIALMCSETDPLKCHRSKLIGRELYYNHNINMSHIISNTEIMDEVSILQKLSKNRIEDKPYFKSGKIKKS